jgi:uncharacterized protein
MPHRLAGQPILQDLAGESRATRRPWHGNHAAIAGLDHGVKGLQGISTGPGALELQLNGAAEAGDLRHAIALLTAGARPTVKEDGGWDRLMHAAAGGNVPVVRLLLARGVDPNTREHKYGFRPLWARSEPISGAGVEVSGKTALIVAVSQGQQDVVRELLDAGADPDARDIRVVAARDWATRVNRPDIAALLLSTRAADSR